jgi:long-subunit acyl-CoA synthetase (AMP-forming)
MTLPGKTLVDLYRRACEEHAEQPALGRRTDRGWVWRTYADLGRDIDDARGGLATLGVRAGDRVAIVAANCAEWPALAVACYGLGAVVVPISEEASPAEWQVILNDSDATLVVAGSEATVDALEDLRDELPRLEHVLGFGLPAEDPRSFAALCELGQRHPVAAVVPAPEAIAELVYGDDESAPVELSHVQLVANVRALQELLPVDPTAPVARTVASVPWAHLLGRLGDLHHGLGSGVAVAIHGPQAGLLADVLEIRPTRLTFGAALATDIHQLVLQDVWQQPALAQRLFHEGMASLAERTAGRPDGLSAPLELFLDEESVFGRIRERLGGRVDHVLCGGALAHEIAGVLRAMDVELVEVDVHAPIDADGHLAVASGRVSYRLAGGSEVVPATIEAAIRQSPYVRDVIVVGEGRRANMALVVPELEAITALAHRLGVPLSHHDDAAVQLLVAEELRQRLQGVLPALVPRRFALLDEPFSVENGLLTPTLELRRERIAEVYAEKLRSLYSTPPPPPRPRRRTPVPADGRA